MKTQGVNINEIIPLKVSEKAICFRGMGESWGFGDKWTSFDLWIPKSIIKDNIIPSWFLLNKQEEKGLKHLTIK